MTDALDPDRLGRVDLHGVSAVHRVMLHTSAAYDRLADHLARRPDMTVRVNAMGRCDLRLGRAFRLREAFRLPAVIRECHWIPASETVMRPDPSGMSVRSGHRTDIRFLTLRGMSRATFLSCSMVGTPPCARMRGNAEWQLRMTSAALRTAALPRPGRVGPENPALRTARSVALAISGILGRPVVIECATPAIAGFDATPARILDGDRADHESTSAILARSPALIDLMQEDSLVTRIGRHNAYGDAGDDPLETMRAIHEIGIAR